jgi:hypothetical protein
MTESPAERGQGLGKSYVSRPVFFKASGTTD